MVVCRKIRAESSSLSCPLQNICGGVLLLLSIECFMDFGYYTYVNKMGAECKCLGLRYVRPEVLTLLPM